MGGAGARRESIRPRCKGADVGVFFGLMGQGYGSGAVAPELEGFTQHGRGIERGLGPRVLRVRFRGTGGHGRHGVFLVAGRDAPRRAGVAGRRVLDGADRWGDGDGDARLLRGVLPPGGARGGRAVQGVLVDGRRDRLGRGRRRGRAGAAVGGAGARAPGAGGAAGFRGEPGRRLERPDGAERSGAATGGPQGARRRGSVTVRCGRRGGARNRDRAGRPDRGAGAAGHLRAGPGHARCGWGR